MLMHLIMERISISRLHLECLISLWRKLLKNLEVEQKL